MTNQWCGGMSRVATGGAAGGIFVALLAPRLFRGYWELSLGLWGSAVLLFLVLARDRHSWLYRGHRALPGLLIVGAALLPGWIVFATHPRVRPLRRSALPVASPILRLQATQILTLICGEPKEK